MAFKSEGLKGQRKKTLPWTVPILRPVPAWKRCWEWVSAFETLMMSATKVEKRTSEVKLCRFPFNSENLIWAPPVCQAQCRSHKDTVMTGGPPRLSGIAWCSGALNKKLDLRDEMKDTLGERKHGKQHLLLHSGPSSWFYWLILLRKRGRRVAVMAGIIIHKAPAFWSPSSDFSIISSQWKWNGEILLIPVQHWKSHGTSECKPTPALGDNFHIELVLDRI